MEICKPNIHCIYYLHKLLNHQKAHFKSSLFFSETLPISLGSTHFKAGSKVNYILICLEPADIDQSEGEGDSETVPAPLPEKKPKVREQYSFSETCKSIIERCMFMLLGVSSAIQQSVPSKKDDANPEPEQKENDSDMTAGKSSICDLGVG